MQRHQKTTIIKFAIIISITFILTFLMVILKDRVNRSEAITAMQGLSIKIQEYKQEYGHVPPKSFVESVRPSLPGGIRLGQLQYRAQWLEFDSPKDSILAYTKKTYEFIKPGYVVLNLDGTVEWMPTDEFEERLKSQQTELERKLKESGI